MGGLPGFTQPSAYGSYYGRHRQASSQIYGGPLGQPGYSTFGSYQVTSNNSLAAYAALFGAASEPPKPEPIENAGIRAGEIRAWRCWVLSRHGFLTSMVTDSVWVPGEPMEGDVDHAGVHAWKSLSGALEYGSVYAWGPSAVIVGQVDLWGKVVEHEIGYRAQFARISSLDRVLAGRSAEREKVGRWPMRRRETRREMLARILADARQEYGLDIPREAN